MNINFNNVRKQACFAFERLVNELNTAQEYEGNILIDPNKIEKPLNDLRQMIGSIAMTYEEGCEEFKDVYEEIYPEPKTMPSFKFEEE